jgi:hypothetical protein
MSNVGRQTLPFRREREGFDFERAGAGRGGEEVA